MNRFRDQGENIVGDKAVSGHNGKIHFKSTPLCYAYTPEMLTGGEGGCVFKC